LVDSTTDDSLLSSNWIEEPDLRPGLRLVSAAAPLLLFCPYGEDLSCNVFCFFDPFSTDAKLSLGRDALEEIWSPLTSW